MKESTEIVCKYFKIEVVTNYGGKCAMIWIKDIDDGTILKHFMVNSSEELKRVWISSIDDIKTW